MKRRKPAGGGKNKLPIFFILFSFLIWGYFSFNVYIFKGRGALSIPVTSRTSLPPVLFFPNISFNVLGSQTINPTDIVKFINIERNKQGAKSLVINEKLMRAARMRAEVILKNQNFSHQDPYDGIELTTVLPKVSYFYSYASENIGMGGVSASDFVFGFMNSTSHKINLLNPELYHTGTHVVTGPYKQYYVNIAVQLFAVPATRDDFLGYNKTDKKNYRKLLNQYNLQLNPLIITIKNLTNKNNTAERIKNVKRQKDILKVLLARINEEKPFEDTHANLIQEYNSYL